MGKMVEKCPSDMLFERPLHPYTQGLLKAIPVPSLGYKDKITNALKGEISSPVNPKPGCRFAPRCPEATEICTSEDPKFMEVESDHFVACHNWDK